MKNISLTEKLIVYFVVLCVLSIGLVSYFSYRNARKAIIDRTFDQLVSIREVKKNNIENFFEDRIKDMNLLATSPAIKTQLKKRTSSQLFRDDNSGKNLFDYILSYKFYNNIFIGNTLEEIIIIPAVEFKKINHPVSQPKEAYLNAFRKLSENKKVFVLDFQEKYSTEPSLLFCCRVYDDNNEMLGYLGLQVSGRAINDIMYENDPSYGFGKTGDFYIVGQDYLMRTVSRFFQNSVMNISVRTSSVINSLNGKAGSNVTKDYRNIPVLSAYQKLNIPDLNWVIIAEIDLKEAMIPIYKIRNELLIIALIITTIIFIIAFFVSKMITMPIIRLNKASEQIANGNLDLNLRVHANDEIGTLTNSFNYMALQLKEQSEKIKLEQLYSMRAMFDGQDMERQRLSREFHDGLGQELIAIKLKLESIENKKSEENKTVTEVKNQIDNLVENIRRISNNLMPAILDEFGLATAIRYLCETVPAQSGLEIKFNNTGNIHILDKRIKTYLYRISQEAITNIIKHSHATFAEIQIKQNPEKISLIIRDSGRGFDMKCIQAGMCRGLKNMRERVNILNGDISIWSEIDVGTTIDINIPIFGAEKQR